MKDKGPPVTAGLNSAAEATEGVPTQVGDRGPQHKDRRGSRRSRIATTDPVDHGGLALREDVGIGVHQHLGAVAEQIGDRSELADMPSALDHVGRCGVPESVGREPWQPGVVDDRGERAIVRPGQDEPALATVRGSPTRAAGLRGMSPSSTASVKAARSTVRQIWMLRRPSFPPAARPSIHVATSSRSSLDSWIAPRPFSMCGIAHSYCWRAFTVMSVRLATYRRTNQLTVPFGRPISVFIERAAAFAERCGPLVDLSLSTP